MLENVYICWKLITIHKKHKMDKINKGYRIKESNVKKVDELAKKERRNIGDQLDIIIEFYFEQNNLKNDKRLN
jgi:hypothetical protein